MRGIKKQIRSNPEMSETEADALLEKLTNAENGKCILLKLN